MPSIFDLQNRIRELEHQMKYVGTSSNEAQLKKENAELRCSHKLRQAILNLGYSIVEDLLTGTVEIQGTPINSESVYRRYAEIAQRDAKIKELEGRIKDLEARTRDCDITAHSLTIALNERRKLSDGYWDRIQKLEKELAKP